MRALGAVIMLGINIRKRFRVAVSALLLAASVVVAQQPNSAPPDTHGSTDNNYLRVLLRPSNPPVFDSQHRPITAGGFVDGAPVVFEDITHKSGIDKFHHHS